MYILRESRRFEDFENLKNFGFLMLFCNQNDLDVKNGFSPNQLIKIQNHAGIRKRRVIAKDFFLEGAKWYVFGSRQYLADIRTEK